LSDATIGSQNIDLFVRRHDWITKHRPICKTPRLDLKTYTYLTISFGTQSIDIFVRLHDWITKHRPICQTTSFGTQNIDLFVRQHHLEHKTLTYLSDNIIWNTKHCPIFWDNTLVFLSYIFMLQAYEDTNVVFISRKSKDAQYNGLKKRLQKKTLFHKKHYTTRTPQKPLEELKYSRRVGSSYSTRYSC
jgi:hypothetical protein